MIVCMSRRIAVELYEEITKLRPSWDKEDLKERIDKSSYDFILIRSRELAEA